MGNNLRIYRETANLSQEKLSRISGISVKSIQKIEEGKKYPSSKTIRHLARFLNIKFETLLHEDLLFDDITEIDKKYNIEGIVNALKRIAGREEKRKRKRGYPEVDENTFSEN